MLGGITLHTFRKKLICDLIYLGLTLLSPHVQGIFKTGSFQGKGNQYILAGQDSVL